MGLFFAPSTGEMQEGERIAFLYPGAFFLGFIVHLRRRTRRLWKKNEGLRHELLLIADDEGIAEEWNGTRVQTVWANVVKWCETENTVAITTNMGIFIVPKARVPAEEMQNLLGLLTGKCVRGAGGFPVENVVEMEKKASV